MDIESVRGFALSLHPQVTEDMFTDGWVSWRIGGKWFMLMQLDAPAPRVAVKLPPEVAVDLRERYGGMRPAYHMNKHHWSDLYLNELNDDFVKEQVTASFRLVASRLPKRTRTQLSINNE
jgi:predicted DNA-binding protein (MmcQ/YjbR family)